MTSNAAQNLEHHLRQELGKVILLVPQAPAWERALGNSSSPKHGKLELVASSSQPGDWELAQVVMCDTTAYLQTLNSNRNQSDI